jgi:aspartate aminotransferase
MDTNQPLIPPSTSGDPRIGVHLNLNVRGLPPSATLAINERSALLGRNGRTIYRLGLGQSPFPVPDVVVQELREHAHEKDYLPVKGLHALREAVAAYQNRQNGHAYAAEDVLIGPGSKELMFLLQLTYYGDLVIPMPSWVSYAPQARIVGRNVYWIPTLPEEDWHLTPEALERLCRLDPGRPRLVILNYPSNPTGRTYAPEALEALADVARQFGVLLLSDEIYGQLHFEGRHVSIANYYPEGTIVSSGLSKWCGAGGWRLGTFLFPRGLRWLLDSMAAVASETYTSTSAPIQYAAVRAFRGGAEIEAYLATSRRILSSLGRHLAGRLRAAGVHVPDPHGAFYLFPDFSSLAGPLRERGIDTSGALCTQLLEETGVAILPGHHFGLSPERLAARLAYVNFNGAAALEAAASIPSEEALDEPFLRAFCGESVRAVELLCDWLGR